MTGADIRILCSGDESERFRSARQHVANIDHRSLSVGFYGLGETESADVTQYLDKQCLDSKQLTHLKTPPVSLYGHSKQVVVCLNVDDVYKLKFYTRACCLH